MSDPYLPPETLDHIIDLLHNEPETLKQCCLVSKSFVPRAQKHLFAKVEFNENRSGLWKKTFPDPTNSPAYHTHTLVVSRASGDKESGLIHWGFSNVARLILEGDWVARNVQPLAALPRFAPSLKSLHLSSNGSPPWEIFDLIRSFPLLEDIILHRGEFYVGSGGPPTAISSVAPPLTGTLVLDMHGMFAVMRAIRVLLDLPAGLRFRNIKLTWYDEEDEEDEAGDQSLMVELVAACSHTLEHLDIWYDLANMFPGPIDLSNATNLKGVTLRCGSPHWCGWIIATLKTITSKHQALRQIAIDIPPDPGYRLRAKWIRGAEPGMQWSDLDRLLVQLQESHSICLKIENPPSMTGGVDEWVGFLLPETTERGTVNLVGRVSHSWSVS